MALKKMSAIAHKTKPVAIKRPALKKTDQYIGTCRSYDEQQPIPSFVRSLTPKNSSVETAIPDSCPDISEKDKEDESVQPVLDTQKERPAGVLGWIKWNNSMRPNSQP